MDVSYKKSLTNLKANKNYKSLARYTHQPTNMYQHCDFHSLSAPVVKFTKEKVLNLIYIGSSNIHFS